MAEIDIDVMGCLNYENTENYRILRTNIGLFGSHIKSIIVTSSIPKEGKTQIAFNLSLSMSMAGKKVLFIDGDLRKSVFMKRYNVEQEVNGLDEFLSGEKDVSDILYTTNIKNLHIVFSGGSCSNSSELLDSEYFKKLIPLLEEKYDYIIIDTPALGSIIDSAIVAQECDGAVMVIEEDAVSYKLAKNVMDQLEETDCTILGVVLNKTHVFKDRKKNKEYYRQ